MIYDLLSLHCIIACVSVNALQFRKLLELRNPAEQFGPGAIADHPMIACCMGIMTQEMGFNLMDTVDGLF